MSANGDVYPRLAHHHGGECYLHLACAPAQIWVVDHLYAWVADWLRYDHQGALFADSLRHGHSTFKGTDIGQHFINDGSISFVGGLAPLR